LGVRIPLALPPKGLMMEKIKSYIYQSKIELDKVIFPTKEQIRNAFVMVIIVVFAVSVFLALVDLIMSFTISKIV
jgi:preprotein translocase, secE subunit